MEFKIYQHRLSELAARFNLMVALVITLLVSNVLLASLSMYMAFHQRIEVTPFFGSPGYIKSESSVDPTYLTLMSENFIYARLNVTPETVKFNHQQLLHFIDSHQYPVFEGQLNKEANLIMDKKIASHFDITDIKADSHQLTCTVKGVLKRSVGLRELADEPLQYTLQFRYHFGRLSVMQFTKEALHETH